MHYGQFWEELRPEYMTHPNEYIQIQKYLFAGDVEGGGPRVADRASGVWDGGRVVEKVLEMLRVGD